MAHNNVKSIVGAQEVLAAFAEIKQPASVPFVTSWNQSTRKEALAWAKSRKLQLDTGVPALSMPFVVENQVLKARMTMMLNIVRVWHYRETGGVGQLRLGKSEVSRAEHDCKTLFMASNVDTTNEDYDVVLEFITKEEVEKRSVAES